MTGQVLRTGQPPNPSVKGLDQFEPFFIHQMARQAGPRNRIGWWTGVSCAARSPSLPAMGGLGKSLICQQLASLTAAWLGKRWMGLRTAHARSLGIFCEDDAATLHRRQESINRHYGCSMLDLSGVWGESMVDRDFILMKFPQWGDDGRRQIPFDQVEQWAAAHKANLIFLDTLSHVFCGNEIDRNQPKTFVRELRKLALRIQGCVILTHHPSQEGLKSGTGTSGSTGWNNSCAAACT